MNEQLGGDEAAEMILYSVNYGEIKKLTQQDKWETLAGIIGDVTITTFDTTLIHAKAAVNFALND